MTKNKYTGREFWVCVTYIAEHGEWLTPDCVCMSIEPIEKL